MTPIVVVTHGLFAEGLVDAARQLLPSAPSEELRAVGLMPEDSIEDLGQRVAGIVQEVDCGTGVLLLTDLMGASPFNATARMQLSGEPVQVVTGVNLPMLHAVIPHMAEMELPELAALAREAGIKGVQST